MKDIICKLFGHKWVYYKVGAETMRCCAHCNRLQHRFQFAGKRHWTFSVRYTKLGAKEHAEGYGEE